MKMRNDHSATIDRVSPGQVGDWAPNNGVKKLIRAGYLTPVKASDLEAVKRYLAAEDEAAAKKAKADSE